MFHGGDDQLVLSDPARSCLILMDIQNTYGDPNFGVGRRLSERGELDSLRWRWDRVRDSVIPNSRRLLEAFRAAGMARLFVTVGAESPDFSDVAPRYRTVFKEANNYVGTRDHEIVDELKPHPDELVINKRTISAFNSTPIDWALRAWGVQDLYFCGVTTNGCVEGTMRDAVDRAYHCQLVEDATGANTQKDHEVGCYNIGALCGPIVSSELLLEAIGSNADPSIVT
jgi:nicotinamidase-related amidase